MAKSIIVCEICNKEFERDIKEINRNTKIGRRTYCSRSCSGIGNQWSLGTYHGNGDLSHIPPEKLKTKKKDQYSPFRKHLGSARKRDTEQNLTLEYLKELWELQNGTCPLTGWVLSLDRSAKPNQASLDRIDSNKGYIQGNVRYVALIANLCKWSFTDEQVIDFCNSVVKHKSI